MSLAELPRPGVVTDDPADNQRYQLTELGERALDGALARMDLPAVSDQDLVQATVDLLEAAVLSPSQVAEVDRASRRALDRWRLTRAS